MKAGTAIRDISPQKPMFLVGYPHVERISTGIHDPLLATALYLESSSSTTIIIAVDILFMDPPTARELRKEISARTNVPEQHIFISCTHTHSGPVTVEMISWQEDPVVPRVDPSYMKFFKEKIIEAAVESTKNTQEAEIAWTSAIVNGVGCNRNHPDGITDPEVSIMVVRNKKAKKNIAISLTYGMHPTVLHEDSKLVSADFPYYTRLHLKEIFGQETTILYHTGPSGNQSPRYHVKEQTFAEAERFGRRLGSFVSSSISKVHDKNFNPSPIINGRINKISCPPKQFPSISESQKIYKKALETFRTLKEKNAPHGPLRTAECTLFGAEELVVLAKAQADGKIKAILSSYVPIEVQVLKIGERCFAGFPCEIFAEYGITLKKMSPKPVVPVSLVNGEMQGYIVTNEALREGGYEAANSLFSPLSGTIMINALLDMISNL